MAVTFRCRRVMWFQDDSASLQKNSPNNVVSNRLDKPALWRVETALFPLVVSTNTITNRAAIIAVVLKDGQTSAVFASSKLIDR